MPVTSALVAVRGEQCDEEVVRFACTLLGDSSCRLYILHVIEVDRQFPVDAEVVPATERGESVLKRVEQVARGFKCKMEAELIQAREAGCAVVQEAVDRNVDTVVVGIPFKERYGTFTLGNTIPYILKNAPCNVVVWRESASDKNGRR